MRDLVHTVIETTKKRYDEYQRKGLKIKRPNIEDVNVRDSALNIVSATLSFQDIIGAAVCCDPTGYAGKVWGIISVGLTDLQASIFQASGLLTDVLSRCAFIEIHCLTSNTTDPETKDMLRNAIVRVYFAVLQYSSSVVSIQHSGAGRQFRLSVIALADQPLTALKTAIGEEEKHLERWVQFDQQLLWKQKAEQTLAQIDDVLSGIQDLSREMELCKLTIAEGAAFDSYMNQHEVECLPGTRTDLLKQVTDWSLSTQGECIFWLSGMAGTGKSTVSRTVCKLLQEQGLLGASFFFKRGKSDCGRAEKFFATIVRQIIIQEPRLIPSIRRAIQRDPSISTKSLGEQFNKLLLEPLLAVKEDPAGISVLAIVVDALDECDPENDIGLLLRLLPRISTQSPIRLRVFLTSRPEIPIREGFDNVSENDHRSIGLHGVVESSIRHDILLFMNDRFEEMRQKFSLPQGWPGESTIRDLVNIATPLFIAAATMCRFIADRRWNPEQRLALVLGSGSTKNAPKSYISKLEHTYLPVFEQILHSRDDDDDEDEKEQLVQEYRVIVGTIIILANPLGLTSLAKLLNMPSNDVSRRLDFLHSVLSIPDDEDTPIQLFHQSFRDFLLHPKVRTKTKFWIDEEHIHRETLFRCIEVMTRENGGLSKNICQLSSDATLRSDINDEVIRDHFSAELRYSCHYWSYHLQQGRYQITDHDEIHKFVQKHLLHWLEAMSVLGLAPEIVRGIRTLQSAVQPHSGRIVSKFLHDAHRFILKNSWVANNAPLQLYAAALAFAPANSVVRDIFQSEIPRCFIKLPSVEENWNAELLSLDIKDVNAVAFSPDSRLIASASMSKQVKLWDSVTGLLLHTLDQVFYTGGLTFSPNGAHVACSSWDDTIQDDTVQLWDIDTGALYKSFPQPTSPVVNLTFSPDNKLLVLATSEDTIDICDLASERVIRTLEGHSDRVNALAISSDSKLIASGSNDNSVRIWKIDTGALLQTLEHSGPIRSLSPNRKLLGSVSSDHKVLLWDATTGSLLHTFEGYSRKSGTFSFSPDSKLVAFRPQSDSTCVQLWDVETAQLYRTLEDHLDSIDRVMFSPNCQQLASIEEGGTITIWNIQTGERMFSLESRGSWVCVAFSRSGAKLATGSYDTVRVWDANTGVLQLELKEHKTIVTAVAFLPDEKLISSGSNDGKLCFWDLSKGELSQTLHSSGAINQIVFSADGRLMASGTLSQTFRLWDRETGHSIYASDYHASHYRDGIANLRFSSDNTYLEADFGRLRIPCNEKNNSISTRRPNIILGEQWLHIGEERVLWLPVEYRPKTSAYYDGTFAIGSESGLVSFISVDMSVDANGHS
ncbi:unnamed protein product [Aspergillus oryzae RIB40]|uniref:DNA, SC038 n=1 Tax=Aspergillus oryzae (strain ATCC 42149 / RIB 40) TaxID=510516 RepID=Q2U2I1_ASPOR|nr:unnamed protein product [Aspergillus oryzae RIB40]BAE64234.1 unnamed protein product [Aspergillus oryzae RIB40]